MVALRVIVMPMKFTTPFALNSTIHKKLAKIITRQPCQKCKKMSYINRHGFLYGQSSQITRGLRFFCSNRYNNRGCGFTFSVLFSSFIPHHSVTTKLLSSLLIGSKTSSIYECYNQSGSVFSITSFYAWMKKLKLNRGRIRPLIPPDMNRFDSTIPLNRDTIELLEKRLTHGDNIVGSFQTTFQQPFFLPLPSKTNVINPAIT